MKSKGRLDYHMVTSRREWIPHQSRGVVGTVRKLKSPSKSFRSNPSKLSGIHPNKPSNWSQKIVAGHHLPKIQERVPVEDFETKSKSREGEEVSRNA